ncbi:GreA/GreB family elongation factor [endosymbiont GvMRE of Glomus versiforme]|uniref:GreA/GreB family elongation factor n=1 Tax=endosymbiont GvMRE of Glomus versiforme TaxID=2039283 RepID=UPI0015586356|nr:GreA/GreB family elongation factor [endosymbiont GvMRE of Glomus versiforme]
MMISLKEKLKLSRLDGDSSENGDSIALEEEIGRLRVITNFLENRLLVMKNANVRQANKTITYKLLETGEEKTIRLTDNWESDPGQGEISVTSPIGEILIDGKVGNTYEIKTNQTNYKVKIISIKQG